MLIGTSCKQIGYFASSFSDNDVTKMEGCPRSLMLNVDLKETFPTEFTPALKAVRQDNHPD